jgi:hypothetical protein
MTLSPTTNAALESTWVTVLLDQDGRDDAIDFGLLVAPVGYLSAL